MLSSDNQDRKQAPVPLSLKTGLIEVMVALSTHPHSDLPSLNTKKTQGSVQWIWNLEVPFKQYAWPDL